MKKANRFSAKLLTNYMMGFVIIPHLFIIFLLFVASRSFENEFLDTGIFCLQLIGFFLLSLYYIPPVLISGGYGFVGQIGVGPDRPIGYMIAITFWSIIAFLAMKLHLHIKHKKTSEPVE